MPIPLALMAAPVVMSGVKTAYTLLNKPKRIEPTETLTALERTISNNQSDIVGKTLMNKLTSNAKSLGATMYQQQQRGLDVMRNTGDLSEGQYAKALLSAGSGIQSEVAKSQETAELAQMDRNQESLNRIENARLQWAQLKDQARQQYATDKQQWQNEVAGGILDTATAGFNMAMQGIQNKNLQDTLTKTLNGRNLVDLDVDELTGLAVTLSLAKEGLDISGTNAAPAEAPVETIIPAEKLLSAQGNPAQGLRENTFDKPNATATLPDADVQTIKQDVERMLLPKQTTPQLKPMQAQTKPTATPTLKPAPTNTKPPATNKTTATVPTFAPTNTKAGKEAMTSIRKVFKGEYLNAYNDKQLIQMFQNKMKLRNTGVLDVDTLMAIRNLTLSTGKGGGK